MECLQNVYMQRLLDLLDRSRHNDDKQAKATELTANKQLDSMLEIRDI